MIDCVAADGRPRCGWTEASLEELAYHDAEWGLPEGDDARLFEQLSLEGFQAGLSWRTILKKRESFRNAFHAFDYRVVSAYDAADIARLLADAGIVRHRGKIEAIINNAARALELRREFGSLAAYFWQYEPPADEILEPLSMSSSPSSVRLSKDLKRRGWKFVGPTTVFAFMQAAGLVNDHSRSCVQYEAAVQARSEFSLPRLGVGDSWP